METVWTDERLDDRFDAIDRRFDAVDQRFDAVDQRFDAVDQRFDAVDRRLDAVDRRLDGIDRRIDRLETEMRDGFAQIRREMHNFMFVVIGGFTAQTAAMVALATQG